MIALDSLYARLLRAELERAVIERIFTEISDFLLLPFGFLMLLGAGACGAALSCSRALYPMMIIWLLAPAVLGIAGFFGPAIEASGNGSSIRLASVAIGAALAMLAVSCFQAQASTPG